MLTTTKKKKLLGNLKAFQKKYFIKKLGDLDESGTRLLINDLLCMCLGYVPLEEVKTEYMIRGTYADYMVQIKGNRHFLVEVKALSLSLSDKHLRQVLEYGANEVSIGPFSQMEKKFTCIESFSISQLMPS